MEQLYWQDMQEKDLQAVFDSWPTSRGRRMAGVPRWLAALGAPKRPRCRVEETRSYDFLCDALWKSGDEAIVAELKLGRKYEPLALAEVLHHAHVLADERVARQAGIHPVKRVRPVIVGQPNSWTRAALGYLAEHGFKGPLDYLEVDSLRGGDAAYLWFDAPLAPWQPASPPPLRSVPSAAHWYRIVETNSWIGTNRAINQRPLLWDEPYTMVAPIDGSERDYLVWSNQEGPSEGAYYRASDS